MLLFSLDALASASTGTENSDKGLEQRRGGGEQELRSQRDVHGGDGHMRVMI